MKRAPEAARLGLLLSFISIALILAQPSAAAAQAGATTGFQLDVILDAGGHACDVLSPGTPISERRDVVAVAMTQPATHSSYEYDGALSNASVSHLIEHGSALPECGTEARSSPTGRTRTPLSATGAATDSADDILRLGTSESWGNPNSLARHFRDHGADFAASSADDYARMASEFLQRPGTLAKIDADGVIRVYDPATNTFGSYNANGTTRTFFKPTSPTYWDRQPGSPPAGG